MTAEPPAIPPGLARMNEVYGWQASDGTGDFWELTRDHLFGEIWNRAGLDVAQRRLLLIGLLAGAGRFDVLELQLDAAFRLGELDAVQLREIVIFVAHYAGWPAAATINTTVETLIAAAAKGGAS